MGKPSFAHLLRVLGIVLVVYFGGQVCSCRSSVIENTFNEIDNTRMTTSYDQTQSVSEIACCIKCNINRWCRSLSYRPSSKECQLSNISSKNVGSNSESDSEWVTFVKDFTACNMFLVSGPNGVNDSQLSSSSYYETRNNGDGRFARYARLNSTGYITGAWAPADKSVDEYIQADFIQVKSITAIALQGRSTYQTDRGTVDPQIPYIQYVTHFKVITSLDCLTFAYVTDTADDLKIFQGNSSPEEIVIRHLPEIVLARCVRVNPVKWFHRSSLRFDVLGC